MPPNSAVAVPCHADHSNEKPSSDFFYPKYWKTSSEATLWKVEDGRPHPQGVGAAGASFRPASRSPLIPGGGGGGGGGSGHRGVKGPRQPPGPPAAPRGFHPGSSSAAWDQARRGSVIPSLVFI